MSASDHPPQLDPETRPLDGDDEYEVITSEEVDHVLDVLDQLIGGIKSENIRLHLEEAADAVYDLMYADDCEDKPESATGQEAA